MSSSDGYDRLCVFFKTRFLLVKIKKAEWNSKFLDELFQFPDPLTHDDLVDALAYVDQLAKIAYAGDFEEYDDYEILDDFAGY